jgi:hypothetical protein
MLAASILPSTWTSYGNWKWPWLRQVAWHCRLKSYANKIQSSVYYYPQFSEYSSSVGWSSQEPGGIQTSGYHSGCYYGYQPSINQRSIGTDHPASRNNEEGFHDPRKQNLSFILGNWASWVLGIRLTEMWEYHVTFESLTVDAGHGSCHLNWICMCNNWQTWFVVVQWWIRNLHRWYAIKLIAIAATCD